MWTPLRRRPLRGAADSWEVRNVPRCATGGRVLEVWQQDCRRATITAQESAGPARGALATPRVAWTGRSLGAWRREWDRATSSRHGGRLPGRGCPGWRPLDSVDAPSVGDSFPVPSGADAMGARPLLCAVASPYTTATADDSHATVAASRGGLRVRRQSGRPQPMPQRPRGALASRETELRHPLDGTARTRALREPRLQGDDRRVVGMLVGPARICRGRGQSVARPPDRGARDTSMFHVKRGSGAPRPSRRSGARVTWA